VVLLVEQIGSAVDHSDELSEDPVVRALDGVTVVDFSQGLCGPFATQHLADLGARVIKVEPPGGDYGRQFGPPFIGGESAVWLSLNRNKESVVLDYRNAAHRDEVIELLERADVVVEDFGPGIADELGFGYEALAVRRPSIIYCALSPFGEEGPWCELPGTELVVQATTEYLSGQGIAGEEPTRLGVDVANVHTALYVVQAILAALYHRGESGEGQLVAVSLLGVLLHQRSVMWASQSDPDAWFGHHVEAFTMPPVHGWETKDKTIYFNMLRADEADWLEILQELDMLHVVTDHRFDDLGHEAVGIGRYAQEVRPIWEEAFKDRTAAELIELFVSHGAFATLVNDYDSLFSDPQVQALDLVREVQHPVIGKYRTIGLTWEIEGAPRREPLPSPPALGQHTDEIMRWLDSPDGKSVED
jgi:crotonobetainyl-CoA:carnitine CoA-transferase CaiB-like acyl-CoA transferase